MTPIGQLFPNVIDSYSEVLAYEYLYSVNGSSLKSISELTVARNCLPSEALVERIVIQEDYEKVKAYIDSKAGRFSAAIDNTPQYPEKLHVANERVPLIYYSGDINLVDWRSVSIVGARKASEEGKMRAARLARILAENDIGVVSGLAAGIDTAALDSAIRNGGKAIAVIGTPIDECYPKENAPLQREIARKHLLVSQVPFYRYHVQPFPSKKIYFRERNVTMAAISDATVIVEASDTSGSLIQARACIKQGRPLFIMRSCLENRGISWPERFIEAGAFALDEPDQLLAALRVEADMRGE